jgi:hypothetical protein
VGSSGSDRPGRGLAAPRARRPDTRRPRAL